MGGWSESEDETVQVELRYLGTKTEQAVHVAPADDYDEDAFVWLPFSQVHGIEGDDGPIGIDELEDLLEQGDAATFDVSLWLAEREGWA